MNKPTHNIDAMGSLNIHLRVVVAGVDEGLALHSQHCEVGSIDTAVF